MNKVESHPVNTRTWKALAGCTSCGRRWEMESAVGQHQFECQSCHTPTGTWVSTVLPPPHTDVWGCNCGCIAFTVAIEGYFCMNCGLMTPREMCKFQLN